MVTCEALGAWHLAEPLVNQWGHPPGIRELHEDDEGKGSYIFDHEAFLLEQHISGGLGPY